MNNLVRLICTGALLLGVVACTGTQSFGLAARAGDTVAFALAHNQTLTKDNIQVTITDSAMTQFVYLQSDPAIRTVFNMYPDPVSRLVVGRDTNQSLGIGAAGLAFNINNAVTGQDNDWSMSSVFIDLPASMATGTAEVTFADDLGQPILSLGTQVKHIVEIIGTGGTPQTFETHEFSTIGAIALPSLERADHYVITFSSAANVDAIQLDLSHNPDSTAGGIGVAHAINTTGNLKSIHWYDDGTNMRVILTSAKQPSTLSIKDYKFYVAGDITGLIIVPSSVAGFDSNGNVVSDVSAQIQ